MHSLAPPHHTPRPPFSALRWLLGLCLTLLLLHPAWAGKRVALVIGNSGYQVESTLPNPVNDAKLIADVLRQQGFEVELLTNLGKREMELALARFARSSAGADSAVVYYAGHGAQPLGGGRNYLLPIDAKVDGDDTLDTDGIAAERIVEQLERNPNPAKLRLLVLDACRSNRLSGKARSGVRGLARMTPSDDATLIAFSTNDQDIALDGSGRNSPYATALALHLQQAGSLPLRRIFELTAQDVRSATGQKQKPRTYGDLDSRTRLDGVQVAQDGGGNPPPVNADAEAWALAKRTHTVEGYQAYLDNFAQGQYVAAARAARDGLKPAPTPVVPPRPQAGQVIQDCADCPELVVLPSGSFEMGSNDGDSDEKPVHRVSVRSFALGRYEVTVGQYMACVRSGGCPEPEWREVGSQYHYKSGSNDLYRKLGSALEGERNPIIGVSWNDAQAYAKWLSGKTGQGYRLPSEAEWEYAGRAGTSTKYWWGDEVGRNNANCNGCGSRWDNKMTAPVGSFAANGFGLHDMSGNAWEWVQDVYHENYSGAPNDGSSWLSGGDGARRVLRGGSWNDDPGYLRSAIRYRYTPGNRNYFVGFRIARTF